MSDIFDLNEDNYENSDKYTVLYVRKGYDVIPVSIKDYAEQYRVLPLVLRKRYMYSQLYCL